MVLPQAKITSAQTVAAGAFPVPANLPPWLAGAASLFQSLPAFCRATAEAHPSADSDIKIEVWMPLTGWNGRFQGLGNGGFAGQIDYRGMAIALSHGYANAATDTGHSGNATDAAWALGHPEKIIDFGYRGIHQMTQIGKATVNAFYASEPKHSYFGSCSNGGRQALMETQRFPEDYDGILAGAPANYWTHLLASALWDAQATTLDAASYIPSSKLPAIASAVNAACDLQDGVADGILNDPRECHFDPSILVCKSGDNDHCLTPPQVAALKKLYQGAHDKHGRIFPGFLPGAEVGEGGWATWITGAAPGRALLFAFGNGYFSDIVYDKADWNYKTADLSQATKAADEKTAKILNATDPDLTAFRSRGGKLIVYHGWNDPAISALNTIDYYKQVLNKMGTQNAESFLRLYMVPGMQHCGGGPGPSAFDARAPHDSQHDARLALEDWVEKGVAPSKMIATKYAGADPSNEVKMTRPLCPYPEVAKYKGAGDPNHAENFECVAGAK
ncbi:MAG TPA: tannase/feruloyl esterase family alpha/beta hydrolase [Terriglobales bacterium]|nr:tannase/feruloyl esterase family alpha/beta hydrolase [Terriglobales bacterium]